MRTQSERGPDSESALRLPVRAAAASCDRVVRPRATSKSLPQRGLGGMRCRAAVSSFSSAAPGVQTLSTFTRTGGAFSWACATAKTGKSVVTTEAQRHKGTFIFILFMPPGSMCLRTDHQNYEGNENSLPPCLCVFVANWFSAHSKPISSPGKEPLQVPRFPTRQEIVVSCSARPKLRGG